MSRVRFQRRGMLAGLAAILFVLANAGGVAARVHPGNEITKNKTLAVAGGTRGGATVKCPAGDRILTGGAYWHEPHENGDATLDVVLDSSAPRPTLAAGMRRASTGPEGHWT